MLIRGSAYLIILCVGMVVAYSKGAHILEGAYRGIPVYYGLEKQHEQYHRRLNISYHNKHSFITYSVRHSIHKEIL